MGGLRLGAGGASSASVCQATGALFTSLQRSECLYLSSGISLHSILNSQLKGAAFVYSYVWNFSVVSSLSRLWLYPTTISQCNLDDFFLFPCHLLLVYCLVSFCEIFLDIFVLRAVGACLAWFGAITLQKLCHLVTLLPAPPAFLHVPPIEKNIAAPTLWIN